jgi:FkbM family methyltransferase
MLSIIMKGTRNSIIMGAACEFEIQPHSSDLNWRVFIIQENTFYLKPLTDWSAGKELHFFPESPGRYVLAVQWRLPDQEKFGWVRHSFDVNINAALDPAPQKIKLANGLQFWVPNGWEAMLLSNYEPTTVDKLRHTVRPKWVIYDIGANLGYYSVLLGRQVGPKGAIYAFEANPVCVGFLRSNLALNQVANCEILPCALSDSHDQVRFTLNYGSSAIGLTQRSSFYESKVGHEVNVQGYPLDELVETFNLRKPDVIKIDIEGAEAFAIAGMLRTLDKYHPLILLELHGRYAAEQTLPQLDQVGYRYDDYSKHMEYSDAVEFLRVFPDIVTQILCLPK